jgi:hypothetical protein
LKAMLAANRQKASPTVPSFRSCSFLRLMCPSQGSRKRRCERPGRRGAVPRPHSGGPGRIRPRRRGGKTGLSRVTCCESLARADLPLLRAGRFRRAATAGAPEDKKFPEAPNVRAVGARASHARGGHSAEGCESGVKSVVRLRGKDRAGRASEGRDARTHTTRGDTA